MKTRKALAVFTTSAVQRPLWFLEGNDFGSQTAYSQLLPPVERGSTVRAVVALPTRRPIEGLAEPQTRRVEPEKSCSPYHFVWGKKVHISGHSSLSLKKVNTKVWLYLPYYSRIKLRTIKH